MVVAVRQPSTECTAMFTVCIVLHRPSPCAVTIHKIALINGEMDSTKTMQTVGALIKILRHDSSNFHS